MKILLLQTEIAWNDRETNFRTASGLIAASPKADLVLLPEMFTTGYATSPEGIAENDGRSLEWMRSAAAQSGAAVAGSVAMCGSDGFRNRFYFVRPDGSYDFYDKRHLFSFAGEDREYTPGNRRVVVEWKGFRILLQVCYDLRFPVFARNRGDYDMIIYAANWPTVRIDVWNSLLKARAIENLCYVAGVNRVGKDPHVDYPGGTRVFDYMGGTVAAAQTQAHEAVFAGIDMEPLAAFRKKFPALADADGFTLDI